MIAVGVDLAGKATNPTGFCVLEIEGEKISTKSKTVLSDEEIIAAVEAAKPDVVAIDAPFRFPEEKEGYFRASDKMLKESGFSPLSPLFRGMQPLVKRAMILVKILRERGYEVIEVFPRATEKIFGMSMAAEANEHEYDALLCALTAKAFLDKKYENLAGIIIPKR